MRVVRGDVAKEGGGVGSLGQQAQMVAYLTLYTFFAIALAFHPLPLCDPGNGIEPGRLHLCKSISKNVPLRIQS